MTGKFVFKGVIRMSRKVSQETKKDWELSVTLISGKVVKEKVRAMGCHMKEKLEHMGRNGWFRKTEEGKAFVPAHAIVQVEYNSLAQEEYKKPIDYSEAQEEHTLLDRRVKQ